MRFALALLLLPLALAVAACGGGSTSATGTGTASGAEVTPADAVAFISLNTDDGSEQWQQADELLKKLPVRDKLLQSLEESLADENLDFEQDVRPALGPTLGLALIETGAGENALVGMTQADDEEKLNALLAKGDEPTAHEDVDGWTVFSDNQAALDAFTADGDKLADDEAFQDAMADLPEAANAKAYLGGAGTTTALRRQVPLFGAAAPTSFDWVSLAVSSEDDGWKIDGFAKGGGGGSEPVDSALLEEIPSGALVAVVFDGSNTSALDQLRKNPALSLQSAQLERLLGISLEDVVGLLRGEVALYVRPGSPIPEVTLISKPDSPDAALQTLDRAITRIGVMTGNAPKRTTIGGVEVRQFDYDEYSFFYGVRDDALVVSTSTAAFRDSSGASLQDDPAFSAAADAVELPDDETALLYVNIRDSVPTIEGLARAAGDPVPPDVSATLNALDSFIAFSTTEGDVAHFTGLLKLS
jgi:Protein of unknown function (DUF3352)